MMDMLERVTSVVLLSALLSCQLQAHECPDDWIYFDVKCYRFVLYPELDHDMARAHCGANGAALVGINTLAEHQFVNGWLMSNDLSRREFYTSGLVRNLEEGDLIWESDGTRVEPNLQFWLSEEDRQDIGQFITYKYGVTTYGWSRAPTSSALPFICEIREDEAFRITEENRDFDYGTDVDDPNAVERGPKFNKQPGDILLVEDLHQVIIDCVAFSNPSPEHRMYKTLTSTGETTLITADLDPRYSLTNGQLVISRPTEREDSGRYHCQASNPKGTVLSHSGLMSFGALGEFSNVQREKVRVQEHGSGVIDCVPPNYKPAVAFGWMKFNPGNFLRTDLMPHLFVSYNGKLYFSEVGIADAAVYYCMVKLMPLRGSSIGTNQPPARVSLPIEMEVTDSLPREWGPEISNDFVAVFPNQPLRGQHVRMECVAFGTMPIHYQWRRDRLPMPLNVSLSEVNRVLEIGNVQLEDAGVYVCRAARGTVATGGAFEEKNVTLVVQSAPYFIYELHDQHVDEGRKLTWRCEARALPAPTYAWLKNGKLLTHESGDVEISANVLTIVDPDAEKHDGMYQCRASNIHGVSYSTGQLRVLGFEPTFSKMPVRSVTIGARAGAVTIVCSPEAAPRPVITWLKNGASVGSPEAVARIRVLSNGNIVIKQLVSSDAGSYTCRAENSHGTDSSVGFLEVLARTTISNPPVNTQVTVNNTAFLACQPSHDPELDLETAWYFQGRPLNWRDTHYLRGTAGGINGLYIQGAQKQHSGRYTCRAKTTFDTVMANATLTVRAPPGEPAGVEVHARFGSGNHKIVLRWTSGATWGASVSHYTVQVSTNFNETWVVWKDDIPESSTIVQGRQRRETTIEDLNPWTSYKFRIRARNIYGPGPYSLPTRFYQTSMAPPRRPPTNITTGDGSVGDLYLVWVPIPLEEQAGPGFGYNIYHRLHSRPNDHWQKNQAGDVDMYVHLVGQEFFYTLYDVMIQPFNDAGAGPNSSVQELYSAEDLPLGTPTNVVIYRYNATALTIKWTPVENTREVMRGRVLGYEINYWEDDPDPLVLNHYTGEACSEATVIGLLARTWYTMDVQVYNLAGPGPISEQFRQRTWNHEIKTQPTEVMVSSHGRDSVFVTWRGVESKPYEESLIGYVMQYWPSTDNIRTAKGIFAGHHNYGVINGLQKNVVYKLRVYPYSRGGDGASSPDRLFTLGGQIRFDPLTTEILASAQRPSDSFVLLCCCLLLVFLT